MAKVAFTPMVEAIVGKLAGSVFQDSYQGFQIRTRVSPRNPQTNYQQLRRGEFAYISGLWRTLTEPQRASFSDAAGSVPEGFNLFVGANVNLSLINEPLISFYTPSSVPDTMPLTIVALEPPVFTVMANSALQIVPAGTSLLLFATMEREPSQLFTNPSMYSPIHSFPAGSYFSDPVDIGPYWQSQFGQFRGSRRICIKSALINPTNGLRGVESFSCKNESVAIDNLIIDSDGTFLIDSDGTFISFP